MDSLSVTWLLQVVNDMVRFGAGLLVQTALILAAGLWISHLLRKRGAAAQSLTLRAFLAAAFLCPLAANLLHITGVPRLQFTLMPASLSGPAEPKVQPPLTLKPSATTPPSSGLHPLASSAPAFGNHTKPLTESGTQPASATLPEAPSHHTSAVAPPTSHHSGALKKPVPSTHAIPSLRAPFYIAFTLLWAAASLVLLLRLLMHHLAVLRLRRTAFQAKPSFTESCQSIAAKLGTNPPPVFQHPEVHSPFLAGCLRPCIFLPLGDGELTLNERAVFFHELAHLTRRDTFWNLLCHLGIALLPFQPLLWVLARHIEETSDFVCDDFVAHHTISGRIYAASLLETAWAFQPARRETIAGVGFISLASSLRRRIARILDTSRAITIRVGTRMLVLISSFCLCITFLSGLISFAQGRKISDTLSRGGKIAAFTLLPLAQKQIAATTKPSIKTDDTNNATPREETTPEDETVAFTDNSIGEPAPAPTVSTEITAPAATMAALSDNNTVPDPFAGAESAVIPDHTASAVENSPVEKTIGNQTGSHADVSFLPSVMTGSGTSNTGSDNTISEVKPGQLYINAKEQECTGLKSNLDWGKQSPVWSPDGKTIAFTEYTGFGIWLAPSEGGEPRLLYNNRGQWEYDGRKFGGGNMRTLCFTPDGKRITIVNYIFDMTKGSRADFSGVEVIVYGIVPVIENIEIVTGYRRIIFMDAIDGCWSPDGKTFVAVTEPEQGQTLGRIVSIDTTTEEKRILAESGASPCISPDGKTVIYTDGSSLYRVPIAGGAPERLPVEGCLWNPRCSPDGVWVLGTGNTNGGASRAWLRAFNLLTGKTNDILSSDTYTFEMGSWSPSGKQYCYTKTSLGGNTGSSIWIADINPATIGTSDSAEENVPTQFRLIGNYPNPFNPSTTIEFSLSLSGKASLTVYNMTGQKVRELVTEQLSAGKHAMVWNGRDDRGKPVSSGVYIARLMMEGKVESHRMTLVK